MHMLQTNDVDEK